MAKQPKDDLEDYIAEQKQLDPEFARVFDEGVRLRELVHELAAKRAELGVSQRELAKRLKTTQSVIARLESFDAEPRFTTLQRYAHALGLRIDWQLQAA